MAIQTAATPGIQSHDERAVLAEFARGTNVADIASARGRDWVANVVLAVCGMDRGRARAAVMAYDSTMATANGRRAVEGQPDRAAAKKATSPAFVEPAPNPIVDAKPKVAPAAATPQTVPRVKVDVSDVSQLLAAAESSSVPRVQAKAAAIRKLVDELVTAMAASEQERVLRATIKALTEQRDKAISELKELTGKPAAVKADQPGAEDQRAIRDWAHQQGLACNAHGRIPRKIVEAWRQRDGAA